MKKALVLFALIFCLGQVFAFVQGTMNLGGTASLSMSKADSDDDTETTLSLRPQIGYFLTDDVCGDLIFIYESQSYDGDTDSALGLGLGARYFWNNAYIGAEFQYDSVNLESLMGTMNMTAMYVAPKLGYLAPLGHKVYLELGAIYELGIGDFGGDGSGPNDGSNLQFNLGLQYFFNR